MVKGGKVLESPDQKDLVEAVIFLLQEVATLNAVQLIADGKIGAVGVLARLLVEGVTLLAHGFMQQIPVAGDHHVKVFVRIPSLATLSAALLTVHGEDGAVGAVVPVRVQEAVRLEPDLSIPSPFVEEQVVRVLLLKLKPVMINAAPKIVIGVSGLISGDV